MQPRATISDLDVLLSGRAVVTLAGTRKHEDKRYTFRVRKFDGKRWSVGLLTGPDNTASYSYIGVIDPDRTFRTTAKSRLSPTSESVRAFRWMLSLLVEDKRPEVRGFRVMWSDRCQRCGRALTVPSSIDRRLGPECASLLVG